MVVLARVPATSGFSTRAFIGRKSPNSVLGAGIRVLHPFTPHASTGSAEGGSEGASRGVFRDINNNAKSGALLRVHPKAPAVILVRTFLDQNVGASARNMLNFGLSGNDP